MITSLETSIQALELADRMIDGMLEEAKGRFNLSQRLHALAEILATNGQVRLVGGV